jgi:predicted nucleic acid-binding protein
MLDADVVIRAENGLFDFRTWVASRPDDQFEVAAVTVAELWHGVERASGAQRLRRQRYLQILLASLPIVSYSEQTAYQHARVWAALESSGKMIGY